MEGRLFLQGNSNILFVLKHLFILFFLSLFTFVSGAQVLPGEGTNLHYRLVGFSAPDIRKSVEYKLEIAEGYYNMPDSFTNKIVKTQLSKSQKFIAEVPWFGSEYTWRIISNDPKSSYAKSKLYHFKTGMSPYVDTQSMRLRIIKPATKFKDAFVFLDGNRTLYDIKGNAVWYLPDNKINKQSDGVRDLKLSPRGTASSVVASMPPSLSTMSTTRIIMPSSR